MSKNDEKAAEFFSDEHRDDHVAALVREGEGYDARIAQAKAAGDKGAESLATSRREQVDAELKRLGADAKPASKRAESR